MYGDYCFWSWLRYWYIDSANYVTMLLLDKSYFDYDYEKPKSPEEMATFDNTAKSEEEIASMLSSFGFGTRKKKKPETLDEIQEYIIKQESYGS